MSNVNIEYNLIFNNVNYLLYLSVEDDVLKINLEAANESLYWKGEFESKYLEEITNRAGSYKSFPVFIKMFMSSLGKETETVLIDLISYKDLEQMKARKMQQNSFNNTVNESVTMSHDPGKVNKKYLIMSYSNEFEKVHYPLPLQYLNPPDTELMLRTIERMRKTITTNKFGPSFSNTSSTINFKEFDDMKQENINLRNNIKLLEGQRKLGAVENDESIRNFSSIKDEYENHRAISENKIKILVKTVEDLKSKLNSQNSSSSTTANQTQNYIKELEAKLEKASDIVANERKKSQVFIDEKIKEIERLQKEIHFFRENEKKLKVKINQHEKDLEIANRKNFYDSKLKFNNSTPKSNFSLKSNSVKSGYSNSSSKKSATPSNTSSVKKNLLVNPYNKFKGLKSKNYSPFKFFDKNKNNAVLKSNRSVKSNSSVGSSNNSIKSSSKTNFSPSHKSTMSNKSSVKKFSNNKLITNPIPKVYSTKNNFSLGNNINKKYTPQVNTNTKQYKLAGINGNSNINSVQNNSTTTNSTNNVNALIEEKANIVGKLKNENNSKVLDANDINEKLGRIQNLLNSAKI